MSPETGDESKSMMFRSSDPRLHLLPFFFFPKGLVGYVDLRDNNIKSGQANCKTGRSGVSFPVQIHCLICLIHQCFVCLGVFYVLETLGISFSIVNIHP